MSNHQVGNGLGYLSSNPANPCAQQPRDQSQEITDAMNSIRDRLNLVQDNIQQLRIRLEPIRELEQGVTTTGGIPPSPARRSMLGTTLYNYADELEGMHYALQALLQSVVL